MIKIEEYKKAKEEKDRLNKLRYKSLVGIDNDRHNLNKKYWDLEKDLKSRERKEMGENEEDRERVLNEFEDLKSPHNDKINAFNRVLSFMEVNKSNTDLNNLKVYYFDYPRNDKGEIIKLKDGMSCDCYPEKIKINIKPIFEIKNDKYAKIGVYLYKNKKPVNKYSLAIIGRSVFNEENLIKLPRNWGVDILSQSENISLPLRDKPTKEELIIWLEKNKDKLINDFLVEHTALEEEYEKVLTQINNDWEIAYYEDKKYYYENHVHNGEEEPKYKKILKKLDQLTINLQIREKQK